MPKGSNAIVLNKNLVILFLVIVGLSLFLGTVVFHKLQSFSTASGVSNPNSNPLKTVNYRKLQFKMPSDYFVTDYNLYNYFRPEREKSSFAYFKSQGGAGWPELVLLKGEQFLNPYETESQVFDELYKSGKDCILIFPNPATAIPGIDDNEDGVNGIYVVATKSEVMNGNQIATRIISGKDAAGRKRYDAILKHQNETYYFETCNLNNEKELYTVIKSLEVRDGDNAQ